jgi:hypothetical protein
MYHCAWLTLLPDVTWLKVTWPEVCSAHARKWGSHPFFWRYYLFPLNVYIIVTKLFNFIDNAAYRFHYTCNNENSCTISFIWLLGYLVEIPQWERGRDRKHHRSTGYISSISTRFKSYFGGSGIGPFFIHLTLRLLSRNTTVRTRTW